MSVQPGPTEKRYAANGVSLIYTVPFLVIEAGDLQVLLNGSLLTSGFTHVGVGLPSSYIEFTLPPTGDLLLQLSVPFQRLNDYQENGDFLSSTVNRDFDRIWQALKQLLRTTGRTPVLGINDIDGEGFYRAKGNGLIDLASADGKDNAATNWKDVKDLVAEVLETGQGPINNAANVVYTYPDNTLHSVQDLSSADGAKGIGYQGGNVFERLALTITPRDKNFGAAGNGVADDTAALVAWASSTLSKRKYLPAGTYKVSAEVIFNPGDYVYGDGDSSVIDASAGIGAALRCVSVTGSLVALPSLASNVNLRANTLPFLAPPVVGFGDVILIWNPTDFSWSNWRADYRAGEWCRAAIVSGSNVTIYGRTYDSYAANAVQMYKLVGPQTIFKDFKINQPFTSNAGLVVDLIDSPVVENVSAGGGVYAGIDIRRCVDKKINCRPKQASVPSGNNYGLAIGNSQGGTVDGVYYGTRHSISIGGGPGIGSVSCRDIDIYAGYKALDGGINSVDLHGNAENIRFHGVGAQNGFVVAGKNNSWYGGVGEGGTNSGIAMYMGEVVEGTFNFVGLTLKSFVDPNPSGNGIMSFQNFTANVKGDCNFVFNGLVLDCPAATTFPILFALNGTPSKINLSFPGGITFTKAAAVTQVLRLRQFGATGRFGSVSMPEVNGIPSAGCAYVSEIGSPIVDKYELPTQVGKVSIAVSTSASAYTQNVAFVHSYPASRTPVVISGGGNPTVAGKRVITGSTNETNSGFVAYVATADVTSFTSSGSADYKWSAALNEM